MARRHTLARIGAVLVAAAALWAILALRGRPAPPAATPPAGPRIAAAAATTPVAIGRRVAGRVVLDGAPAAGATVVLSMRDDAAAGAAPLEQVTGDDGRFDFGAHVAKRYLVEASRPAATSARIVIDARDPAAAPDRIELRLGRCEATIHGVVRDAAGGAIAGARVGETAPWLAGLGATSDERGAYALCVRPGEVTLVVTADGHGAVTFAQVVHQRVRRDVVLAPESIVEGVVVRRHDDAPLPAALVELRPSELVGERPVVAHAISDGSGRFHVAGLAAGRWLASATADRWTSQAPTEVIAEAAATATPIVLRLDRCSRVDGTVTEAGGPVAGAEVRAVLRDTLRPSAETVSAADGRFALPCVPHGAVGFEVANHDVVSPAVVDMRSPRSDVAIEVAARGVIRGRVLDGDLPVADARVEYEGGNRRAVAVTSDASGEFRIAGLGAGSYRVWAAAGDRKAAPRAVDLAPRETVAIDLPLAATASIRGTVVDQDGQPVDDARVTFTRGDGLDRGSAATTPDGAFEIRHLAGEGRYEAGVALGTGRAVPAADGRFPPVELAAAPAQAETRLVVRLERDAIAGTVVDATGAPVADATVVATADGPTPRFRTWMPIPRSLTDGDGAFVLEGLAAGAYALRATAAGGGQATEHGIATGRRDARLTLVAPGRIEGRIEGFASLPDVFAQVADGSAETFVRGFLDGDRFVIRGLAPTRYTVTAQSRSEGAATLVDVHAGRATPVVLRSAGSAAISGRVIDHRTRAPLAGRRCRVFMIAGDGWHGMTRARLDATAESGVDGRFDLDPAPAGDVRVQCFGDPDRYGLSGATLALARGARATAVVEAVRARPPLAELGASMMPRRTAAVLDDLAPGGPADAAGARAGDVVIAVDGASVVGMEANSVSLLIRGRAAGSTARLTVVRGGREVPLAVVLGAAAP